MNEGITFALLSLLAAGVNDVVFKKYSAKDRSRGMYIFGIGSVWFLLQSARFTSAGHALHWDFTTLCFGLAAGVLLVLSNILFLESLTHIHVSLGSTIYRLNTIGVLLLSFLFLHESLDLLKSAGISLGIAGVVLLYQKKNESPGAALAALYLWIAVTASFLRAAYGIVSKSGIMHSADPDAMLLIIALCWIIGGAAYAATREGVFRLTSKKLLYSMISGLLVFLIVNFLMLAVKYGEASVVIPIANMSFVIALLLSALLGYEALTPRKFLAAASAALSIILLTGSS